MATVEPKSLYAVSPAEPQMTYFTVSIDCTAFTDTETDNGGRVSPCVHSDFATAPTTLEQSKLINRGNLRWKMMMESIGIRTNFKVHNIVTTYGSDAGDTPISTLAFGLVFDTPDFIPTTGTGIDGSTSTSTKAGFIQDKIAEALNSTRTENMAVFDPSTVDGTANANQLRTLSITAAPVNAGGGNIIDAITVTEQTAFAPNTSNQLATDNALTYSAE
jgi:hypothetical protein